MFQFLYRQFLKLSWGHMFKNTPQEPLWACGLLLGVITLMVFPFLIPTVIGPLAYCPGFEKVDGQVLDLWYDEDVLVNNRENMLVAEIRYKWEDSDYIVNVTSYQKFHYHSLYLEELYTKRKSLNGAEQTIPVYVCSFYPEFYILQPIMRWPSFFPALGWLMVAEGILFVCFIATVCKYRQDAMRNRRKCWYRKRWYR